MTRQEAVEIVSSLYESHYSALVRYAWRATGSLESAEELVQEAFLELHGALQGGREIGNPMAWTFAAVRNAVRRGLREHINHPVTLTTPEALDCLPAPAAGQVEAGGAGELTRLFHLLSRREEEVLLLRLASLKYEEIAAELGISAKSVSTLLTRAIQKLRKALLAEKAEGVADHSDATKKPLPRTLQ